MKGSNYSALANRMARKSRDTFEVLKPCPLCGTMLHKGETVHSVVYSGGGPRTEDADAEKSENSPNAHKENKPADSLVHMYGCRYCYPANSSTVRTCPVCAQELEPDGYVVARMFQRHGRKHVHVIGCTSCRRVRSKSL
jgi:hypothetical protein